MMIIAATAGGFIWVEGLSWTGWDRLRFVEMREFEIGEEKGRGGCSDRLTVEVEILIHLRVS